MRRCVSLLSFSIRSLAHFSKDQTLNRGSHLPGYAAWEIHPVMKLATGWSSDFFCRACGRPTSSDGAIRLTRAILLNNMGALNIFADRHENSGWANQASIAARS
jgi:hypothetical protein